MEGTEKPTLTFIGTGPGDDGFLTALAREALDAAVRIFAAPSLASRWLSYGVPAQSLPLGKIRETLLLHPADTAILVSGDVGFYSLAGSLAQDVGERYHIRMVNGISSLQLLSSRVGIPWEDTATLSLHGREENRTQIVAFATFYSKVFLLTSGPEDVCYALRVLEQASIPGLEITIGECLGGGNERIRTGNPRQLLEQQPQEPAVLLLQNPTPTPMTRRLRDADFLRGKVPMTKEPVRVLAVDLLDLQSTDVVWDIGAGTGAMTAALAQRTGRGGVWAVERNPAAMELLELNRQKLGLYHIHVIPGEAPDCLVLLPTPDAVFIGGSSGRLDDILRCAQQRNPQVRIVVSAVTLETLYRSVTVMESFGLQVEVQGIQASVMERVGESHMLRGQNPVYLISGRPDE